MSRYLDIAWNSTLGYARYLFSDITHPSLSSYFYLLLLVSLVAFAFEQIKPWRVNQPRFRRDFAIDGFYMFFNFFLFSLIGFNAAANVTSTLFTDSLHAVGVENLVAIEIGSWPVVAQLGVMFVLRDFIHYWIHRLLHKSPVLWRFHQVHHSVTEMGFAAHLRYHPAENVFYRTIEYLPLAAIGFGIDDFLIVHITGLTIGHLNHANVRLPLGPLRYLVNSPEMHLWHHAKELPAERGVNYGLSLIVWDYLFGTAHAAHEEGDLALGFDDVETYPRGFFRQMLEPFRRSR